jgi:MYXO-CTERM domain-containing protein
MRFTASPALGALLACLLSTPALANPNGITGYSSKSGVTCTSCHLRGASVPTVELSGPTSLAAGETGEYTFLIRGGPAVVGGAGIAVSNTSAALTPGSGSGLTTSSGELTHSPAPRSFSNGELRFNFSMKAPASGGTVTLFAAGNSANDDSGTTGDGIATTKLEVTVTGGTPEPEPEPEEARGCSTTGGAPLLLLGLLGVVVRRRPRGLVGHGEGGRAPRALSASC